MLSNETIEKIIRYLKPDSIEDYFCYHGFDKTSIEKSKFKYRDYEEIFINSDIQRNNDFYLNFFPINFFFCNPQRLKEICDRHEIKIEIYINRIEYTDYKLDFVDQYQYYIKYNGYITKNHTSTISITNIKKIERSLLSDLLDELDKLLFKDTTRDIYLYGWRYKKDIHDVIPLENSPIIIDRLNCEVTRRDFKDFKDHTTIDTTIDTNTKEDFKSLETPSHNIYLPQDEIKYDLYGFQYPSLYLVEIDISDIEYKPIDPLYSLYGKDFVYTPVSSSSEFENEEINFIVSYSFPDYDIYLSKEKSRPKFKFSLLDDRFLLRQQILYNVSDHKDCFF